MTTTVEEVAAMLKSQMQPVKVKQIQIAGKNVVRRIMTSIYHWASEINDSSDVIRK